MNQLFLNHVLRRVKEYNLVLPMAETELVRHRRIGKKAIMLLRSAGLTLEPHLREPRKLPD